jgi:hypothetical protein
VRFPIKLLKSSDFKKIESNVWKMQKKIVALEEGNRDILNTAIAQAAQRSKEVDKNNYKTYQSQVNTAYDMYDSKTDYGNELLGGIIDTRTAFLVGEGISYITKKKTTEQYIEKFLTLNKYNGSRLIEMGDLVELEGKNLIVLTPDKKEVLYKGKKIEGHVKARNFSWKRNPYNITLNPKDNDEINKIAYSDKSDFAGEEVAKKDNLVFFKTGGTPGQYKDTPSRTHKVLTDIENFSRRKYDLGKNNHLFGKIMPYWNTEDQESADAINNDIAENKFEIGVGYAGNAVFSLIGPPTGAADSITKELVILMKTISITESIPIHWLAWPELMSNRATAENLLEVVNAGTKKERLILEEKIKEMIEKSMIIAIDSGFEDNNIIGDFTIKLPLISMATLKMLNETWIPLMQAEIVSIDTVRNMTPGINPAVEKKLIEKAKDESVERFQNGLMDAGSPNNPENINNEGNNNDTRENENK